MITIDPIKRPSKPSSSVNTEEIMKEVDQKISDLIGGAPETLDTLKELADALKDNSDIIEVLNENINNKLSKAEAEENYAIKTEIPTKVSQLENDANYIQEDVIDNGVYDRLDDLENQLSNVYTKSEIDNMIISTLNTEV